MYSKDGSAKEISSVMQLKGHKVVVVCIELAIDSFLHINKCLFTLISVCIVITFITL